MTRPETDGDRNDSLSHYDLRLFQAASVRPPLCHSDDHPSLESLSITMTGWTNWT